MANTNTLRQRRRRQRQKDEALAEAEQAEEEHELDARLGVTAAPRGRRYFGGTCLECDRAQWHPNDRARVPLCPECAVLRARREHNDRRRRLGEARAKRERSQR